MGEEEGSINAATAAKNRLRLVIGAKAANKEDIAKWMINPGKYRDWRCCIQVKTVSLDAGAAQLLIDGLSRTPSSPMHLTRTSPLVDVIARGMGRKRGVGQQYDGYGTDLGKVA